ncbi:hypothetical protein F4777DRAFT_579627 [Nemania sp. FL0916]|nr:hypothetical protein F4777DRAFT_579627 [Nemania sp. FL0916]
MESRNAIENNSSNLEKSVSKSADRNVQRPTHLSLPRLQIPAASRPAPVEIPPVMVDQFLIASEMYQLGWGDYLAPSLTDSSCTSSTPDLEYTPGLYYDMDLPTPATLQFTKNEARELAQWKAVVGDLRKSHRDALVEYRHAPRDRTVRKKIRKLRWQRESRLARITRIYNVRRIRQLFRAENNFLCEGW